MRRRLTALALVALASFAAPSSSAAAPGPRPASSAQTVTLRTVPPIAGVHGRVRGGAFVTDGKGRAVLPLSALAPATRQRVLDGSVRDAVPQSARVRPRRLADGGIARLDRFFGTTLALATHYRVTPRFLKADGQPIPPEDVDSYTLRSRHGVVLTARGNESVTLKRSRVVRLARRLVSKPIEWSVERVTVDGTNVVNRAQQRFDPKDLDGTLPIEVLFFSAHITSRDALFGFPSGSSILVTQPDGTTRRYPLEDDGSLVLPSLPRGDYTVAVDAPGMAPPQPVALSRNQEVELKVLSYLDLGLAGGLLGALALGLLVARRPHLRRPPRAARRHTSDDGIAREPADAA